MNHIAKALWLNHGRIARRKRAARLGTSKVFRFDLKHMSAPPLDTDGDLPPSLDYLAGAWQE
jgi:hypothetical protein